LLESGGVDENLSNIKAIKWGDGRNFSFAGHAAMGNSGRNHMNGVKNHRY